ncbi:MAG: hypothetical protein OXH37_00765, partial [Gammaproteobacteria bacterium]|nr:hypothetical protein [Gammaproteobacteria bacterium]
MQIYSAKVGAMALAKKKVAVQLPRRAHTEVLAERYALELEALAPVADIVEVAGSSAAEFAAGAADADAIITSWGIQIDRTVIDQLDRCVVIGVGSVGVDMVGGKGQESPADSARK